MIRRQTHSGGMPWALADSFPPPPLLIIPLGFAVRVVVERSTHVRRAAVVIGSRISADAIAVVVGVACGVLASVPISLLMIWALRYCQQERSEG